MKRIENYTIQQLHLKPWIISIDGIDNNNKLKKKTRGNLNKKKTGGKKKKSNNNNKYPSFEQLEQLNRLARSNRNDVGAALKRNKKKSNMLENSEL